MNPEKQYLCKINCIETMIHRDTNHISEHIDSAVPASWMLVYLVFRGIAENKIQEASRLWIESQEYSWPKKEVSFFKAFHSLYEELCVRVSKEFTCQGITEATIRDMQFVASEIVHVFEDNQSIIMQFGGEQSGDFQEEAYAIYSNCRVIEKILMWKDEYEPDWDERKFEFFSDVFLRSLYESLVTCFASNEQRDKLVSYTDFRAALNLEEIVLFEKDNGTIEDVNLGNVKICPVEKNGMLMYSLLAFLAVKRNANCQKNPVILYKNTENGPIEIEPQDGTFECDYYLPDKGYWIRSFMERMVWSTDYIILDDLWKTAYYNSDRLNEVLSNKEVSDQDCALLNSIVHRGVFGSVCSPENIISIANQDIKDLTANDYLFIRETFAPEGKNVETKMRDFYHLLCRETDYFYRNIDFLASVFKTEDEEEYIKWLSRTHHRLNNDLAKEIRQTFQDSRSVLDTNAIYSLLMERAPFGDLSLYEQRSITSNAMRRYVKNCILQDEKIKQVLLQKMEEMSFLKVIKTPKLEENYRQAILEELRKKGLIDSNCVIKNRKIHELLRFLIEREYLTPQQGWRTTLKEEMEKQKPSLPVEDPDKKKKKIRQDILNDGEKFKLFFSLFTALIDWESFSNKFYQIGNSVALSGDYLRDSFNSNPQLGVNRKGEDYEVEIVRKLVLKYRPV